MTKEELKKHYYERKQFCINNAKNCALEHLTGNQEYAEKNKERALNYFNKAQVWEEAIQELENLED